ncbi:hypothetical protein M0R04_11470 [Candidatus Dojkabacteria bacterium]|jgi:hypothetical protein|nr:hypothetical protein [Candidatus Dojkabacteria bacterium]
MSEAIAVVETAPVVEATWDNLETISHFDEAPAESITKEVEGEPTEITEEVNEVEPKLEEPVTQEKSADDSEVEVKINGKVEKVSLKDLKSNYSGKVAYDQKFSEIDKQHKSVLKEKTNLQQEVDQINTYVNTFADRMKKQDAVGAMSYLAEFSGMSPAAMKQMLINQLLPEINRQSGLTESERDLELTKEEIAFQKTLQERELVKLKQENSQKSAELETTRLKMKSGVSDTEWDEAFEFLDTHLDKNKVITRNDVVDYAIWKRADTKTTNVLSDFDGGKYLQNVEVRDTLNKIATQNPDFTNDDLNQVLKEAFKSKIQEKLEKVTVSKNVSPKFRDDKGKFTHSSVALDSWD